MRKFTLFVLVHLFGCGLSVTIGLTADVVIPNASLPALYRKSGAIKDEIASVPGATSIQTSAILASTFDHSMVAAEATKMDGDSSQASHSYADGSDNAPNGIPNNPRMLSGVAVRPPWHVAGVDYRTGINAGVALINIVTNPPPGVTIDATNKLARVDTSTIDVTINGYDFSPDGGYGIYWNKGKHNLTITNSKFVVTENNVVPLNVGLEASGFLTFRYNDVDGGGRSTQTVDKLIYVPGGGNSFVIEYNYFHDAASDVIDVFGNNLVSSTVRFNYFENAMYFAEAHADFIQYAGGPQNGILVEFNTAWQGAADVNGFPGSLNSFLRIGDQGGAATSNATVRYNTYRGSNDRAPHMTVAGINGLATNNFLQITCTNDPGSKVINFKAIGNYFAGPRVLPFYPTGKCALGSSYSSNIDMDSGRPLAGP